MGKSGNANGAIQEQVSSGGGVGRRLLASVLVCLVLVSCSAGTPSNEQAEDYFLAQLRAGVNGKSTVIDFEKTDGLKSVKDGVDTYEMEFVAKAELPGGPWEHDVYRGKITFIRSERGWKPTGVNAASDAETALREKHERQRGMEARATQGIRVLESALQLYKLDNFTYPTTAQGLRALIEQPTTEPLAKNWKPEGYVKADQLKDPWGNDYRYESPGKHGEIDIYTYGEDNAPGGYEVLTQDTGNWDLGS